MLSWMHPAWSHIDDSSQFCVRVVIRGGACTLLAFVYLICFCMPDLRWTGDERLGRDVRVL